MISSNNTSATDKIDQELIFAYLAGFIDADGSITIINHHYNSNNPNKKNSFRVKLSAHNCKKEPIQLLINMFGGGKLRCRKQKTNDNRDASKWRPCYEWTLTAKQAEYAIKKLLPYLKIKHIQARQCLRLGALMTKYNAATRRHHPDIDLRCRKIFQKLKEKCNKLNKRGI